MKKFSFSLLLVSSISLLAYTGVFAQEKREEKKDKSKLGEYDEIIIRQKPGKDAKVTVEIKDGKVTVNGKPMEEYKDGDLIIRRRERERISLNGPSPFRNFDQGGVWNFENDDRDLAMPPVNRAFLGVATEEKEGGASVNSVTKGSAAEMAGLKEGDVITKIDDQDINNPEELTEAIGKYAPGDKVTITYKRGGKENQVAATLTKNKMMVERRKMELAGPENPRFEFRMPDMEQFHFRGDLAPELLRVGRPRLGIRAQDTEDGSGVKVLEVLDESVAEKSGIKKDDIITEFDGKKVNSADELAEAAQGARDKNTVSIKLMREGKPMNLEIKIPRKLKTANL